MKYAEEAILLIFGGAAFTIMWVLSYELDGILFDLVAAGLGLAIIGCAILMVKRIDRKERKLDN